MYSTEVQKRIYIRVKRIKKIRSETGRLPFVETVSLFKILLGRIKYP